MGNLERMVPWQVLGKGIDKFVEKIKPASDPGLRGGAPEAEDSDKSHNDTTRDTYNKKAEHADKKPMGQEIFDKGNEILEAIKKIDPSNSSGAVQPAVDIMKKLLKNEDPLKALQGMMGGELYGIMNQVMALINKKGSGGGGNNGGVQPQQPCMIDDPSPEAAIKRKMGVETLVKGTLQYDRNSVLTCVPNKPDGTPGMVK